DRAGADQAAQTGQPGAGIVGHDGEALRPARGERLQQCHWRAAVAETAHQHRRAIVDVAHGGIHGGNGLVDHASAPGSSSITQLVRSSPLPSIEVRTTSLGGWARGWFISLPAPLRAPFARTSPGSTRARVLTYSLTASGLKIMPEVASCCTISSLTLHVSMRS